ncbi:MAG TPA: hypothetical protein VLZ83_05520 [Edaphocola sp.]|nr:hypothetical protein [Edaphocola sp.]
MKKLLLICFGLLLLASCEPDIIGEGINLPEMKFGFNVSPDTSYVKVGDTITLFASIPSTLNNGVKITDGKAIIAASMGYKNEIPFQNLAMKSAKIKEEFELIEFAGGVTYTLSGSIREFFAFIDGDSIKFAAKIIPKKFGTYAIQLSSKFYEGSAGKTRTRPSFDMLDTHWDLHQIPGYPAPQPGEESYFKSYWFAVYE